MKQLGQLLLVAARGHRWPLMCAMGTRRSCSSSKHRFFNAKLVYQSVDTLPFLFSGAFRYPTIIVRITMNRLTERLPNDY